MVARIRGKFDKLLFIILNIKEFLVRLFIEKSAIKTVKKNGVYNIPIIINNFNRHGALIKLIDWLNSAGYENIIILDNQSTYPPLLEYYKQQTHCTVIHLGANLGHKALWKSSVYNKIRNSYFCYTDPDLVPVLECPKDLLLHLIELLWKYPNVVKAGTGLRITDIPDHFKLKDDVLAWETRHWKDSVEKNVFNAPVDTTFALYRPRTLHNVFAPALRTGEPYTMHHTPWYINSENLTDEEIFYRNKSTEISWWSSSSNTGPNRIKQLLNLTK